MKPILTLGIIFFCVTLAARDHRVEVVATIVDDDGLPVEGARVCLDLPRYGTGRESITREQFSDRDGRVRIVGSAEASYRVTAEKAGYYGFTTGRRELVTPTSQAKFGGIQELQLQLRPIKNPVGPIVKAVRERVPSIGVPIGFDLEAGDWVRPSGRGDHADLFVEVDGFFESTKKHHIRAKLSFAGPVDGLQGHRFDPLAGSDLKFPHEAPLTGYEQTLQWEMTPAGTTLKIEEGKAYIFRTRTELDDDGNIERALYGTIGGEIRLSGSSLETATLEFAYQLNPTWTRSLEFDQTKAQRASTGKVQP
jgi:hypothetical protein